MSTTPDGGVSDYKATAKRVAHQLLDPIVRGMLGIGLQPDHLTMLGFALSLGAGVAFAIGKFRIAASIATVAGICDNPRRPARAHRRQGHAVRRVPRLDARSHRRGGAVRGPGLVLHGPARGHDHESRSRPRQPAAQSVSDNVRIHRAVRRARLVGSFMVSYTRARAEGSGSSARSDGSSDRNAWWC
jgi:hypothetical protein